MNLRLDVPLAFFEDPVRNKASLALLSMQRHNWEQGIAMQAFFEAGRMDVVITLARESAYRALSDGRVAMIGQMDGVTDPCLCGEALLAAAKATGEKDLAVAERRLRIWALTGAPRNQDNTVYHLTEGKQFWVDSLYMLPPYLVSAGEVDVGLSNFYGLWNVLYDEKAGLLRHIWDDGAKTFIDASHWGTGNGWALAAFARIIPALPEGYEKDKEKLIQMAAALLDRVLSCRREDGSFTNILDDPGTFQENNLCQMCAYAIYRGIYDGWLERHYLNNADELRKIALSAMDEWGFVHNVCGAPTFDKPGMSPEAEAFTILCESARLHLTDVQ